MVLIRFFHAHPPCQGIYYMRIVSGVEPTSFTLLANLSFYTPEIDKARGGPGAGYRYSLSQKRCASDASWRCLGSSDFGRGGVNAGELFRGGVFMKVW